MKCDKQNSFLMHCAKSFIIHGNEVFFARLTEIFETKK